MYHLKEEKRLCSTSKTILWSASHLILNQWTWLRTMLIVRGRIRLRNSGNTWHLTRRTSVTTTRSSTNKTTRRSSTSWIENWMRTSRSATPEESSKSWTIYVWSGKMMTARLMNESSRWLKLYLLSFLTIKKKFKPRRFSEETTSNLWLN